MSKRVFFICWVFFNTSALLFAQVPDSLLNKKSKTPDFPEMDLFDLGDRITGRPYKRGSTKPQTITVLPSFNYSQHTSWAFGALSNISFHLGTSKKTNLSVFNLFALYTLNKQIILMVKPGIWSNDNLFNIVGDWRFYKYPSYTYGLGPETTKADKQLIEFSYFRFYQLVYRKLMPGLYAGGGYNLDYRYDIEQKAGLETTDFKTYDGLSKTNSSGFVLSTLYDTRLNQINPIPGAHYVNLAYRNNIKSLGSTYDWQQIILDARKYIAFPSNSVNILAFWSYNSLTFGGKVPYLDLPASSMDTYDNQGRGYIQGRFRSNRLLSFETEYRFKLTRNRLLGGVVFSNMQAVDDPKTKKFNSVFPAAGFGLRIKLDKRSNTNAAIDYSFGINGERGFSFNLGEVF